MIPETTKECVDCKLPKLLSQFYAAKSTKDKRANRCIECQCRKNSDYKKGKKGAGSRTSAAQVSHYSATIKRDVDEDFLGFIGSPLFEDVKAQVLLCIQSKKKPCSMLDIRKYVEKLDLIDYRHLHNYLGEAVRDLENTDIKRIEDFVDRWTLKG
jgi:hypothetical protein